MTPSADRNRATVRGAFAAWAAGEGDIFDLLADDACWTIAGSGPGTGTWHGRQAYIDAAVTPLFDRLAAPTVPDVIGIWADGDEVVVRWRQDTPVKGGGSYRNAYAWFFTMQDDKVTAVTAFLDLRAYGDVVGRKS